MSFWRGKKVFITGHTGFKGSWLSIWLNLLGAKVVGYALLPPTDPSLFEICRVDDFVDSIIADTNDGERLQREMSCAKPEIVFHLAAQSLVRVSYEKPIDTYSTNVMGTANLLEAARKCPSVKAIVNVTTDKCYENHELERAFRENDPLGGYDPYSSSKACSEIVTAAYRSSYFREKGSTAVATARAGNVIGGGDWARDRLVPDFIRAVLEGKKICVRNPKAVRPWQHVLEPLSGYLLLAEKLCRHGQKYAGAWNFGPEKKDAKPVEWIIRRLCEKWDGDCQYEIDARRHPHEAGYLRLSNLKAKRALGWKPKWRLETALDKIIEWTKACKGGKNMEEACNSQIKEYSGKP